MKKFILALSFLLTFSCSGTCNHQLPETTEPEVEIITEEQKNSGTTGILVYSPTTLEAPLECDFKKLRYSLEPIKIEEQPIKHVYKGFQEEYSERVMRWVAYWTSVSDYVFVAGASVDSIQGDELNFIHWAVIILQDEEVIWYDDWQVFYDGTVDIKPHIKNAHIQFEVEGRGMSPTQDTLVQFELDFLFLQNCKEE